MQIKQPDLDTDVNKQGILEAFKNSMIEIGDWTIRGIIEAYNLILVQTDDKMYHVIQVELEKRHNNKLYVTDHKVIRTYSGKFYQDELSDSQQRMYPPDTLTDNLMQYADVVAHFMMLTHGGTDPDQEWTQQILGVDGKNKTMLIYEDHLGQAIEVRFIKVENALYVYGLPFKYWDWHA